MMAFLFGMTSAYDKHDVIPPLGYKQVCDYFTNEVEGIEIVEGGQAAIGRNE